MGSRSWARHLAAVAGYLGVTVVFSWPLPLRLDSVLTGPPSGDTGVYVWNLWVFRHEIVRHHVSPLFTREILSLSPSLPLTLHNYTTFADLVAFPLIPILGVTATFNVIYLASSTLTAYAMFLLARQATRTTGEAWLAGLLFGFSPALIARSTAHFSLVQAAPLPIYLLLLRRLERKASAGDALLAGTTLAWAYMCDPYYAVYAVLLGICYISSYARLSSRSISPGTRRVRRAVDALIVGLIAVSFWIVLNGGGQFEIWGLHVSATTVYTPMLALTILLVGRIAMSTKVLWREMQVPLHLFSTRVLGLAAIACLAVLSPILYTMLAHASETSWIRPRIFWRSSPPGVDALAFVLPNPNHALFGASSAQWLTNRPNGFAENVASLPLVALLTVGIAYGIYRFRRGWVWAAMAAAFAWVALGPFIFVGGVNTQVPTAWALLRYVPIVGGARMPARLAIVAILSFAVLFALALKRITAAHRTHRTWILAGVAGLLLFELSPMPRSLYDARVPSIYETIAGDPRAVRVLEIPFGIRDGLSSHGNFSAASQFYQTLHEKPLIGGYLSRMPQSEIHAYRRQTVLSALLRLSEGASLTPRELAPVRQRGPGFIERARIGYVVVDLHQASPELVTFVEDAFTLVQVGEDAGKRLYRTTCCRRRTLPVTERER